MDAWRSIRMPGQPGRYHLMRLKEAHAPRIHVDLDLSVFVLSGSIHVYSEDGDQELRSGRGIDIPHGSWYASEPVDGGEATLLLMFSAPRRKSAPPNTPSQKLPAPEKTESAKLE